MPASNSVHMCSRTDRTDYENSRRPSITSGGGVGLGVVSATFASKE